MTTKAKQVLIALDYDPSAQKVADKGFLFAKTMKARVTLLHVIANPSHYTSIGRVTILGFSGHLDTSKKVVEVDLEPDEISSQFLDKTKRYLGDDRIQTQTKEGDFAECILTVAKSIHADVIVMGSHSRKWFENTAMGSVTERVLLYTTIPVLIIPTKK
ncbi:universal stress protein [Sunxiuqinia elliptica]|uniref:Universal stress protein n=1 Tax=Sunxiuqinia elliptica TaxID=655355 RepID=A0A1I2FY45_9BACT|nr:universal stress protein [Sunxiuqinia elliptica]SFF09620.1 Nucleotide-binding universal stress protein, UspA family [Sunxiuqinia elliptica]